MRLRSVLVHCIVDRPEEVSVNKRARSRPTLFLACRMGWSEEMCLQSVCLSVGPKCLIRGARTTDGSGSQSTLLCRLAEGFTVGAI